MEYLWGAVLIGCGIFIAVYGQMLFRFVLAVMGFAFGFGIAMVVLDEQETAVRIVIGLVVGAIAALALFSMIRIGLYIAGGLLGTVVGLVVSALLGLTDDGIGWSSLLLVVIGAGSIGFFGKRLGDWIIILASAGVGAFMVVYGLIVWFEDDLSVDVEVPSTALNESALVVAFVIIAVISALAQMNIANLRRRLLN